MNIITFKSAENMENMKNMEMEESNRERMIFGNMEILKQNLPFLKYPKCVIIQPSPELCGQVRGVIQSICRPFGIRVEAWSEDHIPSPMPCLYDYLHSHYDDNDDIHSQIQSAPEILVTTPSVLKHVFNKRFVLRLNFSD